MFYFFFWWGENTGLGLSTSDGFNFSAWDNVRLNTDHWCVDNWLETPKYSEIHLSPTQTHCSVNGSELTSGRVYSLAD